MKVFVPEALTRDEQWERLKKWLNESIEAIEHGDLSRLPASFTGERGEAAMAYALLPLQHIVAGEDDESQMRPANFA